MNFMSALKAAALDAFALGTQSVLDGLTGPAIAQSSAPPASAPAPATVPAEPARSDDAAPPSDQADANPTPAPDEVKSKPAAAKGSPQRFEPTEKVRPDFDVAFPVDI